MNEKLKAFYEAVSADGKLQEELVAVTEGVGLESVSEEEARVAIAEAVAAFATSHDLDVTVEDVLAADEEVAEGKLSDDELETVAGGECTCVLIGMIKGCGCFILGASENMRGEEFCPFSGGI